MPPTFANGKICYLEIPATDIARSAEFYRSAFGWNIRKRSLFSCTYPNANLVPKLLEVKWWFREKPRNSSYPLHERPEERMPRAFQSSSHRAFVPRPNGQAGSYS